MELLVLLDIDSVALSKGTPSRCLSSTQSWPLLPGLSQPSQASGTGSTVTTLSLLLELAMAPSGFRRLSPFSSVSSVSVVKTRAPRRATLSLPRPVREEKLPPFGFQGIYPSPQCPPCSRCPCPLRQGPCPGHSHRSPIFRHSTRPRHWQSPHPPWS